MAIDEGWWRRPGSRPSEIAERGSAQSSGGWSLPPATGGYVPRPGGGYSGPPGGYTPMQGQGGGAYPGMDWEGRGPTRGTRQEYTPLSAQQPAGEWGWGYDPRANPLDLGGAATPSLLSEQTAQTLAGAAQETADWFNTTQRKIDAEAGRGEYVPIEGPQPLPEQTGETPLWENLVNIWGPMAGSVWQNITQAPVVGRPAMAGAEALGVVGGAGLQAIDYPRQKLWEGVGRTALGIEEAKQTPWTGAPDAFLRGFARPEGAAIGAVAPTIAYQQATGETRTAEQTAMSAAQLGREGKSFWEIEAEVGNPTVQFLAAMVADPLNLVGVGATGRRVGNWRNVATRMYDEPTRMTAQQIERAMESGRLLKIKSGPVEAAADVFLPRTPAARADFALNNTDLVTRAVLTAGETPEQGFELLKLFVQGVDKPAAADVLDPVLGNLHRSLGGKQAGVVLKRAFTDEATGVVDFTRLDKIITSAPTADDAALALLEHQQKALGQFYKVEARPGGSFANTRFVEVNPAKRAINAGNSVFARYFHLGFNPAFAVRNQISNVIHAAVDGNFAFQTTTQMGKWAERFGNIPRGAVAGYAGASGMDVGMAVAARDWNKLSLPRTLERLKDIRQGPSLAWSQALEQHSGFHIWATRAQKEWGSAWHVGRAIPNSPALQALDPVMRRRVTTAVERAMNIPELAQFERELDRLARTGVAGDGWRGVDGELRELLVQVNPNALDMVEDAARTSARMDDYVARLRQMADDSDRHVRIALDQDTPFVPKTDPALMDIQTIREVGSATDAEQFTQAIASARVQRETARHRAWGLVKEQLTPQQEGVVQQVRYQQTYRRAEAFNQADTATRRYLRKEVDYRTADAEKRAIWDRTHGAIEQDFDALRAQMGPDAEPTIRVMLAEEDEITHAVQTIAERDAIWSRYRAGEIPYDAAKQEVGQAWAEHVRYTVQRYERAWLENGGDAARGPASLVGTQPMPVRIHQLRETLGQAALDAGIPGLRYNKAGELVDNPQMLNAIKKDLGLATRPRSINDLTREQLEQAIAGMRARKAAQAAPKAAPAAAPAPAPAAPRPPTRLERLRGVKPQEIGGVPTTETPISEWMGRLGVREVETPPAQITPGGEPVLDVVPPAAAVQTTAHPLSLDEYARSSGKGLDTLTADELERLAADLEKQGNDLLMRAEPEMRGYQGATERTKVGGYSYGDVFGNIEMRYSGQMSRKEMEALKQQWKVEAERAASEYTGELLRRAGLTPEEVGQLNPKQRQEMLKEIGGGKLSRTKEGAPKTIDGLRPQRRKDLLRRVIDRELKDDIQGAAVYPERYYAYTVMGWGEEAKARAEILRWAETVPPQTRVEELQVWREVKAAQEKQLRVARWDSIDAEEARHALRDAEHRIWALERTRPQMGEIAPAAPTGQAPMFTAPRAPTPEAPPPAPPGEQGKLFNLRPDYDDPARREQRKKFGRRGPGGEYIPPDDFMTMADEAAAPRGIAPRGQNVAQAAADDIGSTPPPRAAISAENSARTRLLLDEIAARAALHAGDAAPPLTRQQVVALKRWLRDVRREMTRTKTIVADTALQDRNFALHNYADTRTSDSLMSYATMYSYWPSRTAANWAKRVANNPSLAANYIRYKRMMEQRNKDLPEYYRRQWQIGPFFIDIEKSLNPLYSLIYDYNSKLKDTGPFGQTMQDIQNIGVTGAPSPLITLMHAMNLYAQGDIDGARAWAGALGQPTRTLKNASALLREQVPATASFIPPGGITVEPWNWSGGRPFQGADVFEERRLGRTMYGLEQEGALSREQALDALQAQRGPGYDVALQRTVAERAPGVLVGGILGQGFKLRLPYEVEIDTAAEEWYNTVLPAAFAEGVTAEQRSALFNDFYTKYPWYTEVQLARKTGDERDAAYARNVLSRLPPGNERDRALEAAKLDKDMVNRYYDNPQMTGWAEQDRARFMAGILDLAHGLKIPDAMTAAEWRDVRAKNRAIYEERDRRWPHYDQQNAEYWRLRETQGEDVANEYARQQGLFDAWKFAREKVVQDPQLFAYYGQPDDLERYARDQIYAERDRRWPEFERVNAEYMSFPKGSQQRREILAANPWLKEAWDFSSQQRATLEAQPPTQPPGGAVAARGPQMRTDMVMDVMPPTVAVVEQWRPMIESVSLEAGIDPRVVATIIYLESNGNPNAVGRDQDTGLMQVVARDSGKTWASARPTKGELLDPEFNIKTGVSIFKSALDANGGDVRKALAQYNTGKGDTETDDARAYLAAYDKAWQALWGTGSESPGTMAQGAPTVSREMAAYATGTQQPAAPTAAPAPAAVAYQRTQPFTPLYPSGGRGYSGRGGGGGGRGGGVSASVLRRMSPALWQQLMLFFNGAGQLDSGALAELAGLGVSDPEQLRPLFAQGVPRPQPASSRGRSSGWRSW